MTTTAPPAAPTQRFALDGYRAIAAIAVLTFHSYQYHRSGPDSTWPLEGTAWHEVIMHTDLAVDLFFVLSGLILGVPYARAALGKGRTRSAREFLVRRVARLFPLYYAVVLLVWCTTNPELPGDWRDLVLHLTFTHVYSDEKIFYTNGPAWTLAVEVHFFLLLVVLGSLAQRCCRRLASPRARCAVLVGGVAVLLLTSWAYRIWASLIARHPWEDWSIWFSPLAKLDTFAVGLGMAVVVATGVRLTGRRQQLLLAAAGIALVVVTAELNPTADMTSWWAHTVFAAACAMIMGSSVLAPRQPRWLDNRLMAFLGITSYGVYLWQEPVQRVLVALGPVPDAQPGPVFLHTAALTYVVTLGTAWVGYHLIERTGVLIARTVTSDGRSRDYYPPAGPPPPPHGAPPDRQPRTEVAGPRQEAGSGRPAPVDAAGPRRLAIVPPAP